MYSLKVYNSVDCSFTKIRGSFIFADMCEVEIFLVKMKYKIEDVYKNNDLEVYFDDELIFTGTLKQFKRYINNQEEDET